MRPIDPVFECLPFASWVYNPADLKFMAVNPRALEIYGYTRDEFLSMTIADIRPAEDMARLKAMLEQRETRLSSGVWRHRRKNGQLVEVEVASSAIEYNGIPARLAVVIDVSGKTYQEERLSIALGGAKLGIWEYDIAAGLLHWDYVYSGIYGFGDGNLPSTPDEFLDLVDPEMRDEVRSAFFRCVEQGIDYETEFRVNLPDNATRWRYAFGKRVTDLAGTPVKVIGIGMDTTERKRMEQEIAQNQKFEAVGRLAGGIAHDFNNLLTVVIGHADLLSSEVDLNLVRESADQIARAASRASGLVRQLLEFSRTRPQRPTPICLNRVISDTLGLVRKLLPSSMAIHADLDPNAPAVLADPGQIEQVIMNLCLNARDAIAEVGTIQIRTYPQTTPTGAPQLVLEVCDNGTGIDEKTVNLIFDPFFTTKPVDKGTGLGLSIVRGIIKQLGGTIEVLTLAGQGSTFRIELPGIDAPPEG